MKYAKTLLLLLCLVPGAAFAGGEAIPEMLAKYEAEGASNFTAKGVEALWNKKVKSEEDGMERSCATCHGTDLTKQGKHYKTGKVIEPMALSANPERYKETKEIKKWFLRNQKRSKNGSCETANGHGAGSVRLRKRATS